jgi:Zn-dependent protease with chaperone function
VTNVTGLRDFVTGGWVYSKSSCCIICSYNPKEPDMGLVAKFLSSFFSSKTDELKDPSDIAPEILELIEKHSSKIKIKVQDTQKIYAYTNLRSSIIVLSRGIFDKFKDPEIKVFVAHELGHIQYKDKFQKFKLIFFCIIGFSIGLFLIGCMKMTLVNMPWSLGVLLLCVSCITYKFLSHSDEYRADNFAITEASISAESFAQCFSKVDIILEEEYAAESLLISSAQRLGRNFTHPPIKMRISRVRTLYKVI